MRDVGNMPYTGNMNRSEEITYHRDIFIPTNVTVPAKAVDVEYAPHAVKASSDDRYGSIPRVRRINLADPRLQIIEVTLDVETRKLTKILVRFPHPERSQDDIILVLRTRPKAWLAVTTWVNRRDDKHHTLDRSKYGTR